MLRGFVKACGQGHPGPASVIVWVTVAAAHDGDDASAGEAVTVFEDRRGAERGRCFDDEASVIERHSHGGDDRRLLNQDGIVSEPVAVIAAATIASRCTPVNYSARRI